MYREGGNTFAVSKEVKDQILALFLRHSLSKVNENDYSALVYSQFYRVCSNKWGMGNPDLKDKFSNQQMHYRQINKAIALLAHSPYQFLFGCSLVQPPENISKTAIPQNAPDQQSFAIAVENYLQEQLKICLKTIMTQKEERQKQLKSQINQIRNNQDLNLAFLKQLKEKWNTILVEALNISALAQIANDIRECAERIKHFRKKLAQATITVHGNEVIQACFKQKGEK